MKFWAKFLLDLKITWKLLMLWHSMLYFIAPDVWLNILLQESKNRKYPQYHLGWLYQYSFSEFVSYLIISVFMTFLSDNVWCLSLWLSVWKLNYFYIRSHTCILATEQHFWMNISKRKSLQCARSFFVFKCNMISSII